MRAALFKGLLVAALMLTTAVAPAADLRVRVDAREVARKRVHTDLTLAVHEGPLTLVFPKWIPGEHGPTGPLESIIGLAIRANGAPLAWRRDPRDMYAISVTVPRGAAHLDIGKVATGKPVEEIRQLPVVIVLLKVRAIVAAGETSPIVLGECAAHPVRFDEGRHRHQLLVFGDGHRLHHALGIGKTGGAKI